MGVVPKDAPAKKGKYSVVVFYLTANTVSGRADE